MGKIPNKEFFELEVGDYFLFTEDSQHFPIEYYGIVWMKKSDDTIISSAPFSRFPDEVYLGSTTDKVYPLPKTYVNPLI